MNFFTNSLANNFKMITGQQSWELLAWTMCYFLVAGTAVALAGALLRFLCKRLAPQIRYTASLTVFATLAMLPFGIALWLSPSMPVANIPTPIVIDLADTPITLSPVEQPIELTNLVIAETHTPDAVPLVVALARQHEWVMVDRAIEFLPWLWLLGTPLTFLLLATGFIGSNRLRRQCKQLTEGPIFEATQRLRSTLAVSQRVGIAINERIATPLLIGIVRPLILLPPAALTGWSPDELEMVLLHELAHVRRWDNLVNFGQRLVESLLFFHPAVWWVSRWVRRDREECCDAVVVARTAKPQAYAELLVALATPQSLSSPPLAGLAMAQHPLAGRIRRILHLEEEKMLITRSTLGLVGFFVVALLGIVLWQPVTPTVAQETPNEVTEQKELTTEGTESTEEAEQVTEEKSIILNARTPVSEINAFIKRFQADGKSIIRIGKNEDDSMIITTRQGNQPPTTITSKEFEVFNDGKIKSEGLIHATMPNQPSPFPTLEAQQSADLAYKLLGIELEQLDQAELARVKAMEFGGGLRVASGKNVGSLGMGGGPFHSGDLLVGLHVWPTTSLEEVKRVLERVDLEDLSPLKFYVIRKTIQRDDLSQRQINQMEPQLGRLNQERVQKNPKKRGLNSEGRGRGGYGGEDGGGYGGEMGGYGGGYGSLANSKTVDQLVTGRIEVNIDAMKKKAAGRVITPPSGGEYFGDPVPSAISWPRQQPKLNNQSRYQPATMRNIEVSRILPQGQPPVFPPARAVDRQSQQPEFSILKSNTSVKPTLLYEGKDFAHWRSQWKNELSIKNHTETVRAMAAFGNAGHGKEAAKVILEIAGQYDWMNIGDNKSIQPFQEACCSAFGASGWKSVAHPLPRKDAQEALFAEMHSENVRVRAFLTYVVPSYKPLIEIHKEHQKEDVELKKYMKLNPNRASGLGGGRGGAIERFQHQKNSTNNLPRLAL